MSEEEVSSEVDSSADDIKDDSGNKTLIPNDTSSVIQSPPRYEIRPELADRFQIASVREIIINTLNETLKGCEYESSQAEKLVKLIASKTKERVNRLEMKRYRLIVQVILGEIAGAGIKSGIRCLWDSECDNYISDMFQNEHLFCHITVFGIYFY